MSESTRTSQADLCYVKRCCCVVFSLQAGRKTSGETILQTHPCPPPPPPPHTHTTHRHAHCFSSWGWKSYIVWRQTERGGSRNFVHIFLRTWKEKQGHFLTWKESACEISVDSDQCEVNRNKVVYRCLSLPLTPSIFPNGPATRPVWHQIKIRGRWGSYGFLV